MTRRSSIGVWFAVLLALAACSKKEEAGAAKSTPPVTVSVAAVEQVDLPVTIQAMGNAVSCHSVAVKAQVEGTLAQAHVSDGQEVTRGAPLFDLDDRIPKQRLMRLKADLERDLAQLENALGKERRQAALNKEKFGSEEALAGLTAARRALEASVAADRAAIAEAELTLSFTRIVSPIDGVAGRLLIHPGNLVKANDANPMVVINQVDPICIDFTVAEHFFATLREHHAKSPLTLLVHPNRETANPIPATVIALENSVDRQSASLTLRARAANAARRLWPGLFVNLVLKVTDRPGALTIPAQALQTGLRGPFVYVVKEDLSVESRPVTLAWEDKERAVIDSGLQTGEKVVTVGQWRLKPGAKVEIASKGG
ncbi:MAG: efflux RND transporter periplasmic adaptor subunit [Magnetococcales bacterium]|nr:efflux RND transporter periplasmic adaptor subunit [Magnetococcales bacterium]